MNVIRHDDPGVQLVMSNLGATIDRIEDHPGKGGLPEEGGATPSFIQQAIHLQKGLSRTDA